MPREKGLTRKASKGMLRLLDNAPNVFNDEEMAKELLISRVPENGKHQGRPLPREPRGK